MREKARPERLDRVARQARDVTTAAASLLNAHEAAHASTRPQVRDQRRHGRTRSPIVSLRTARVDSASASASLREASSKTVHTSPSTSVNVKLAGSAAKWSLEIATRRGSERGSGDAATRFVTPRCESLTVMDDMVVGEY